MYSPKTIACALMLLGYAAVALADNTIVLWQEPNDPNIPPSAYTIVQINRTITINDPGGYIFRFYAHDGSGTPGTGVIDNITLADPNTATGDFSLHIADPNFPSDPNKPGALHWKAGDLTYAGGTSTLLGLCLGGDLATEDNVYLESVSGDIYVAGKLHEDGHPQELTYDLVVDGDIDGNIFVEELHGEILVPNGTVSGDITTGTVPFTPRTGGGVDIGGSYSATITVDDGFDGRIAIGGGLVNGGRIDVMGPNLGQIELGGDLVAPAQIFSHGFVSQPKNSLPPSIRVRGSLDAGESGPPPITIGTEDYHHLMGGWPTLRAAKDGGAIFVSRRVA